MTTHKNSKIRSTTGDTPHSRRPPGRRGPQLVVVGVLAFVLGFVLHSMDIHVQAVRWAEARTDPAYLKRVTGYWRGDLELPTLAIDVKLKHLQRISDHRNAALENATEELFAAEFVPATLLFGGSVVPAKLGLKGDFADHFHEGKWSFDIQVDGSTQLEGMSAFSIDHPATRKFVYEWSFLQALRREGVLAPRYEFVNVLLNGEHRGIHAFQERPGSTFLTAQARREGVIVQPMPLKAFAGSLGADNGSIYHWGFDGAYLEASLIPKELDDPAITAQYEGALTLLRAFQENQFTPSEVFDVRSMSRYMALTELFAARHALEWTNSLFYFNPINARLEPIGRDARPFAVEGGMTDAGLLWNHAWRKAFLSDPVMAEAYVRELARVCRPEYLEQLRADIGAEVQALIDALSGEFALHEALRSPWEDLGLRQEQIRKLLSPKRMLVAYGRMGNERKRMDDYHVQVRNDLDLPIEIVGLQIGDGAVQSPDRLWQEHAEDPTAVTSRSRLLLPVASVDEPQRYARFVIPKKWFQGVRGNALRRPVFVHSRIAGLDRVTTTQVVEAPLPVATAAFDQNITPAQALERHGFLERRGAAKELWIKKGTWKVQDDLIVPAGFALRCGPDVVLKFAPATVFVVQGPLLFEGNETDPIILEPLKDSWPGLVVLSSERESHLKYVTIRRTRGVQRGGWTLTGGVTFYQNPVHIAHCRFEDVLAEDALNIIATDFTIADTVFEKCSSDAFDGDFVRGTIENCDLRKIGGDGIDTSGSNVIVRNTRCSEIADKAVSAGENSRLELSGMELRDVGIGLASKDSSHIRGVDISIVNGRIGLAAYVKKPEFGPAHIEVDRARISETRVHTKVQRGSSVLLNGELAGSSDFDVKALYATGVLGN